MNFKVLCYSLFLIINLSLFAQNKSNTYKIGNETVAQEASKNKKLVVFLKEGNTFNSKPDKITAGKYITGINLFFRNGIKNKFHTYFPTEVQVYFQKDSLNKTSWCKIYFDGKEYSIPYPKLIADREDSNIPINGYHPKELGIKQNIIQITRDANIYEFTDSRDGTKYKAITYTFKNGKKKTWMIENLRFKSKYSISYNNSDKLNKKYGLLYRIMDSKGILIDPCPTGWSLPTLNDWDMLSEKFGGKNESGKQLKSISGWMYYDYNERKKKNNGLSGNNYSGMNILPGGRGFTKENNSIGYVTLDTDANFWSKNLHYYPRGEYDKYYFDIISFEGSNNDTGGTLTKYKFTSHGQKDYNSCRCVKN